MLWDPVDNIPKPQFYKVSGAQLSGPRVQKE